MSTLIRPRGWGRTSPTPGVGIDWGHPLAEGLRFALAGGRVAHGLGPMFGTPDGTVTVRNTPRGPALYSPNARDLFQLPYFPLQGATVLMDGLTASSGVVYPMAFGPVGAAGTGSSGWGIYVSSGTVGIASNGLTSLTGATWPANIRQTVTISVTRSAAATCYIDGRKKATATASGVGSPGTSLYLLGSGMSDRWSGDLTRVYLWNRALTAAEVEWLQVEPYAMFTPQNPRNRTWIDLASAPSGSFVGWGIPA